MPDYIAEARQKRLVDGTAFEISVVVSPVQPLIRDLPNEALRIAAAGFEARLQSALYIDPVSDQHLVVVLVGDITPAYQGSNRDPQQFGGAYRVGILRED